MKKFQFAAKAAPFVVAAHIALLLAGCASHRDTHAWPGDVHQRVGYRAEHGTVLVRHHSSQPGSRPVHRAGFKKVAHEPAEPDDGGAVPAPTVRAHPVAKAERIVAPASPRILPPVMASEPVSGPAAATGDPAPHKQPMPERGTVASGMPADSVVKPLRSAHSEVAKPGASEALEPKPVARPPAIARPAPLERTAPVERPAVDRPPTHTTGAEPLKSAQPKAADAAPLPSVPDRSSTAVRRAPSSEDAAPAAAPPAVAQPAVRPAAQTKATAAPAGAASSAPSTPSSAKAGPSSIGAQIEQAELLLRIGNVHGAREVLDPVVKAGSPDAIVALARTYDPNELNGLLVPPGSADAKKAIELYTDAARRGSVVAKVKLERLQAGAAAGQPAGGPVPAEKK